MGHMPDFIGKARWLKERSCPKGHIAQGEATAEGRAPAKGIVHKKGGETVDGKREEKTAAERDFFLLRGLTPDERDAFWAAAPPSVAFRRGDIIYSPSRFRRALGLLLSGRWRVLRAVGDAHATGSAVDATGGESNAVREAAEAGAHSGGGNAPDTNEDRRPPVVMRRLTAGEVFGAAALYGEVDAYVTDIVADTDATVLFLSQEELSVLFRRWPTTAENYIAFLSDRIRVLNQRIESFTAGSAEERLYGWLLSHRRADNVTVSPISMTELARTLDIGRSSLYRALDALEAAGKLVRPDAKTIRLSPEITAEN